MAFLSKRVFLFFKMFMVIGVLGLLVLLVLLLLMSVFSNKLEGLANNSNEEKEEEKKTIPVPSPPYYSSLPPDAYANMATVQANLSSQSEYDTTAY